MNFEDIKEYQEMQKVVAYFHSKDEYIYCLLKCIEKLNFVENELLSQDRDNETCQQIKEIINRLSRELGFRIVGVFETECNICIEERKSATNGGTN